MNQHIVAPMSLNTDAKNLIEHWDWAAGKGLMNRATAASLKSAASKVLGVLDDWETVNVREIDVEDVILRFQTLHARDFTPASLETYASRFRKAVQLFLEYVANPAGWRVAGRPKRQKSRTDSAKGKEDSASEETTNPNSDRTEDGGGRPSNEPEPPHLITYPFPLRKGMTVKVSLPEDLTSAEARRLGAFLMTLSNDFTGNESD